MKTVDKLWVASLIGYTLGHKQKGPARGRAFPLHACASASALVVGRDFAEGGGDAVELGFERGAEGRHGRDNHNTNQGGDQAVLDCSRAVFRLQQFADLLHHGFFPSCRVYRHPCPVGAKPDGQHRTLRLYVRGLNARQRDLVTSILTTNYSFRRFAGTFCGLGVSQGLADIPTV